MTPDQYDKLLQDQGGLCAICRKPETFKINGKVCCLGVDHDHTTNNIRGLLCRRCNLTLGFIGDSVPTAFAIIRYLVKYGAADVITDADLEPNSIPNPDIFRNE